ncbi:hypothetical protein JCM8547_000639 [Rhodosporidiobolus lusitaniae]
MSATKDIELASFSSATAVLESLATPPTGGSESGNTAVGRESREGEGERREEEQPPANKEAFESYPDDAWGLVAAIFVLFSTTVGGVYSYGVYQDALVAEGLADSSTLSWIGSTQATIQAIMAVPNSRLVAAYGPRNVALVGSFFTFAGPVLAGFCTKSVGGLVVTEGLMFGYGQSLIFFAGATLPSAYFRRRRNIATGLVYSGGGVGGAVFSIIVAQLLQVMSLPWTFRTMGFIFGALNFPAAMYLKGRAPREPFRPSKKILDWSLFRDIRFVLLLVGTAIALFPLFVPPFFLPLYGTSIGLSTTESSLILAGFNLASGAGRIGFGLGADSVLGSLNALVICLTMVGVSTLVIWPLATSLGPLVAFAVINGLCAGGMFSLIPGVLSSVFGSERLSVVFSMIVSSWTPGYFLGSPIAVCLMIFPSRTDLLQAYGGPDAGFGAYRPAIFYSGALSMVSAILVLTVRLKESTKVWKKM